MLDRKLFLEENAAPHYRGHAVGRYHGGCKRRVRRIGKGVDIGKLTSSLEDRAGLFGDLALGNEPLLFNA